MGVKIAQRDGGKLGWSLLHRTSCATSPFPPQGPSASFVLSSVLGVEHNIPDQEALQPFILS